MERSNTSRDKKRFSKKPEDAAQQEAHPPSKTLQALRRALLNAQRQNKELAAENAALKEQVASKDISWEAEKKMLLEKTVESERAARTKLDAERRNMDRRMREKEKEVHSLREHLRFQQTQTEMAKKQWMAEVASIKEMELSFDQSIIQFTAAWESRLTAREEKAVAELKALQESCDKRVKDITLQQEQHISSARADNLVLIYRNLEHLDKIKTLEAKIKQKEIEWQEDVRTLEENLRREQEVKEDELQQQNKAEDRWLAKQEDWIKKVSCIEEEIQRLILQNIELQELALKSDRDKAKIRKEEEKRLKKEMKEKKEQEKKEKMEREENERKEMKEKEEQEKKERKKLKEKKEQENKEKKEREKKEKKEMKEKKKQEKEREKEKKQ
ncbi:golgin subfamily A member 6-like protein 22 [Seriola aureovittata]|uniref:golgin subfamily A member 6-like protein 22 n=1 Tax=Seriola aureovittata TaxID=2871759 RepID=UPI0024BD9CD2|nr:golgin subfamily A member 6-like protein 22 [Seriola aureovittata]